MLTRFTTLIYQPKYSLAVSVGDQDDFCPDPTLQILRIRANDEPKIVYLPNVSEFFTLSPKCKFHFMPGEVALSFNPSYWEARTVGWFEAERPLSASSDGFPGPHYGFLLGNGVSGAGQSQLTKKTWHFCSSEGIPGEHSSQHSQTLFSIL
jgi:hypothetical protein